MNIKAVLLGACAVLFNQTGLVLGGPILNTVAETPSALNGPGGNPGTNDMVTNLACFDALTGLFISCVYDFSITGLKQPDSDPANNGGHSHNTAAYPHPLGKLKVILPTPGLQNTTLRGSTQQSYVYFSHEMPDVSGKIETVMNLVPPPGYTTPTAPISCYGDYKTVCINTTVEVGVSNLKWLPDAPSLYTKDRNPDAAHTNAVAFYGTDSALRNLNKIAYWYKRLYQTLSINDMSLIQGGLFDVYRNYSTPHSWHRTGESVDINKTENGDCKKNIKLLIAVYLAMGRGGQVFTNRSLPSFGHFLCETNHNNNIHIDL